VKTCKFTDPPIGDSAEFPTSVSDGKLG